MSLFESASLVVTPNGVKEGKLYSIKPTDGSGDLSVVRATTATKVNASGLIESVANNVPRLDYSNGSCPSILVEPQRTNIALYSEQFDNASWLKGQTTITTNNTTAPDGSNTADLLLENTLNSTHNLASNYLINFISGTAYTTTIYAKNITNGRGFIQIAGFGLGSGATNIYANFNIANGTLGSYSGGTATIQSMGNGWYRCVFSFTCGNTISERINYSLITASNSTSFQNYVGDTSKGVYLWGAQLELGTYATSYIPTTTASVTRNADVISKTGISSLIGQTEGTLFFDLKTIANNNFKRLSINGGSYVNSIFFDFDNSNNLYAKIFNSGSAVATLLASGVNIENRNKIAIAYKNNDFSFYVNGLQVASQTSGNVPSGLVNYEFSLGGNEKYEGNINSAAIWKTRLSNSELATLTTI